MLSAILALRARRGLQQAGSPGHQIDSSTSNHLPRRPQEKPRQSAPSQPDPRTPGIANLARACIEDIREFLKAPSAIILIEQRGFWHSIASYGLSHSADIFMTVAPDTDGIAPVSEVQVVTSSDLPPQLARALDAHRWWLRTTIPHNGRRVGEILVASDQEPSEVARYFLLQSSAELGTAFGASRLFTRAIELAETTQRNALGAQLHDGIGRTLSHLRLQLRIFAGSHDLERRSSQLELTRIGRIAEHAHRDAQSIVKRLGRPGGPPGLTASLRHYISRLQAVTPIKLTLRASDAARLPEDLHHELFYVAQQAVLDAVHRPSVSSISVSIDFAPRGLQRVVRLQVDDDSTETGQEGPTPHAAGPHVAEIVRRLSGHVLVGKTPGAGNRFFVECPAPMDTAPVGDLAKIRTLR